MGKICIPPRRKAIIIMSHQVMEAIVKQQPNKLQLYLCLTLQSGTFRKPSLTRSTKSYQYHPTCGPMQILHFDWLRCQGTISNSHRVAKLVPSSVTLSFVLFPNKYFFNLYLVTLLLPFLSDQLGDTKTIRPFTLKGHGSIAHEAKPHGLLTRSPQGLQV